MTPAGFIAKWRPVELKERSTAQTHFNDLCRLLDLEDPVAADPKGDWFTFEKGATKTGGGEGWADVWRRGCFGWEYKGRHKDLEAAYRQLQNYAVALENPPLLVTCDTDRIVIRSNFTDTVQETNTLALDDLIDGAKRDLLRTVFTEPERLRPRRTRDALTAEAASKFSQLALRLRERGHAPEAVAHFVNRLVFCMFAEDVGLLPDRLFHRVLEASRERPTTFDEHARGLFETMHKGGTFALQTVPWFNGGLFDDAEALALERADLEDLIVAAKLDWSQIDPSILGTLFERGLDPGKRSQLGAHYTDRDKILRIVDPVIVRPLLAQWAEVRGRIEATLAAAPKETAEKLLRGAELAARTRAEKTAEALHRSFLDRLKGFRVLDPACGSGNFLYLALRALKDIEHRANLEAEALGLLRGFPEVGPEAVRGIEINPYAAELARVSVWIGEIQWMRANGFDASRNPILRPLETIECRDAILNADGTEAVWPEADVIVGNPPFPGAKIMKGRLGAAETQRIRAAFAGRLPGFTDLVCYWFEKARAAIAEGRTKRAGLVATSSIAKNTNLPVLRRIAGDLAIYEAYSDESWVVDGAAVRVALICFASPDDAPAERSLNGKIVATINPDLTSGVNVSEARALKENRAKSMLGIQKSGPFDVTGDVARDWLRQPLNPNGRRNAEVLRPYRNGDDLTSRPRDVWFIDLPRGLSEGDAAAFEAPFAHLLTERDENGLSLRELRLQHGEGTAVTRWWEPWRPRPEMRRQIESFGRYIVTPETAEHRIFAWLSYPVLPDKNLIVIPRDDDVAFGVLQSIFHEKWSTHMGNRMGKGNQRRYNNSTCFDTFPFPHGLTPDIPAADYADNPRAEAIAVAVAELNAKREAWLNPADLVVRVPEVVPGYPDRILPKDAAAAAALKKRTLTNLYNARPAWLDHAHGKLDQAVAEAYGWGEDQRAGRLDEGEILARLFALNQGRA